MIQTDSIFYWIDSVNETNFFFDFNEGLGELSAEIGSGSYTPSDLAAQVESALNEIGTLGYSVSFDRVARKYTISASAPFDLLISTGTHVGSDVFALLGFSGGDLTGSSSYTSQVAVGYTYQPQFKLQDYVDPEDLQRSINPSVNKSANGLVEVVRFGIEKFFEFNIRFCTDIDQGIGGPIRTNLNGVADVRRFMRFCTTKSELEFMPNILDRNDFYKILLESTEEDSKGTGYRLRELYTSNLPGYYDTGKLVFRLVEG